MSWTKCEFLRFLDFFLLSDSPHAAFLFFQKRTENASWQLQQGHTFNHKYSTLSNTKCWLDSNCRKSNYKYKNRKSINNTWKVAVKSCTPWQKALSIFAALPTWDLLTVLTELELPKELPYPYHTVQSPEVYWLKRAAAEYF